MVEDSLVSSEHQSVPGGHADRLPKQGDLYYHSERS